MYYILKTWDISNLPLFTFYKVRLGPYMPSDSRLIIDPYCAVCVPIHGCLHAPTEPAIETQHTYLPASNLGIPLNIIKTRAALSEFLFLFYIFSTSACSNHLKTTYLRHIHIHIIYLQYLRYLRHTHHLLNLTLLEGPPEDTRHL